MTSCPTQNFGKAVKQSENRSHRDKQAGKDVPCFVSPLSKTTLGGDLSTFMARSTGTNMALQSGRDGKAKNQVLERGAKSELLG